MFQELLFDGIFKMVFVFWLLDVLVRICLLIALITRFWGPKSLRLLCGCVF